MISIGGVSLEFDSGAIVIPGLLTGVAGCAKAVLLDVGACSWLVPVVLPHPTSSTTTMIIVERTCGEIFFMAHILWFMRAV